ncbi:hypothetical protein DACRYDRAFT_95361 [Dacryopinax primogenitus]|uniref:Uncharacterized protein n=1 Tax=Dacryopinax primogenitus (strain DJM 731) TaxID=1858805 RepID=M5GB71_DACPD|nr:uncharacterized protein DACRYDRAFT_95361 [Dacryopinax primogenitus]EJU01203.1 hypothetical protein DACRYDRAFT_95361 [Dacryopinax primogenitus]
MLFSKVVLMLSTLFVTLLATAHPDPPSQREHGSNALSLRDISTADLIDDIYSSFDDFEGSDHLIGRQQPVKGSRVELTDNPSKKGIVEDVRLKTSGEQTFRVTWDDDVKHPGYYKGGKLTVI